MSQNAGSYHPSKQAWNLDQTVKSKIKKKIEHYKVAEIFRTYKLD